MNADTPKTRLLTAEEQVALGVRVPPRREEYLRLAGRREWRVLLATGKHHKRAER